jgi:hypothetical protein
LKEESLHLELVDTTIKIESFFFAVFTVTRPKTHQLDFLKKMLDVAEEMNIAWDSRYLFSGIPDVGTKFIEHFCSTLKPYLSHDEKNLNRRLQEFDSVGNASAEKSIVKDSCT